MYDASSAAVRVNLASGEGRGGDAAGDRLTGVENLTGSRFDDVLTGDANANFFEGLAGADVMRGGGGEDYVTYEGSPAGVRVDLASGVARQGHAAGDRLTGIETLTGSALADALTGDDAGVDDQLNGLAGADVLTGLTGDDDLEGGEGADRLIGGAGADFASYDSAAAGVTVDLATGRAGGGEAEGDRLTGVEGLEGSAYADALTGANGGNDLAGLAGADVLRGLAGDDTIDGGAGLDVLAGGAGRDLFDFDTIEGGADRIADFRAGDGGDVLNVSDLAEGDAILARMTASGADGILQVDVDGGAGAAGFTDVAVVAGGATLAVAAIDGNGNVFLAAGG